ncbi:general transcription repressor [Hanseniaspora vineae]
MPNTGRQTGGNNNNNNNNNTTTTILVTTTTTSTASTTQDNKHNESNDGVNHNNNQMENGATADNTEQIQMSMTKLNDYLEGIKHEFNFVTNEINSYRLQNQKDYDFKINQQMIELTNIRNTVYELELTHRKMKDVYEDEIQRLKLELENKDRQLLQYQQQYNNAMAVAQAQAAQVQAVQQQQQQQAQQVQQHSTSSTTSSTTTSSTTSSTTAASSTTTTTTNLGQGSPSMQNGTMSHPNSTVLPQIQLPQINQQQQQQPPTLAPITSQQLSQQQVSQLPQPPAVHQSPSLAPAIAKSESIAAAPSSTTAAAASAAAASASAAAPTLPVQQVPPQVSPQPTKEEQAQVNKEHYLVPAAQRSTHSKPIPPFLLDLDSQMVPSDLKKQTQDYYILYNPALQPNEIDVELHKSLNHSSVVCCVKFSNDGSLLATGCNKTTQVYDVKTGELIARLYSENGSTNGTATTNANEDITTTNTSANGTTTHDTTATATSNGELNGKDTDAAKESNDDSAAAATAAAAAAAAAGSNNSSSDLYIRSVCFSPDGKFLATGAEDKLIRIWDLTSKKIVMTLKGHEQDIYSLDYFPQGNKLVSGSGDRTVRIWDLTTGQCSLILSIEDGVTTVAVSPVDGKYVAAGSLDRTVRVWDSQTGFLVERLDSENELGTGHKDSVYSVVFTKNGQNVVSGSLDRSIKLWSLKSIADASATDAQNNTNKNNSTRCEVTYTGHKDFVLSVATAANDEYILSGSKDRGVLFWDTKSGNPLLMLQGHKNSVISVAVANGQPLGPEYAGVFATGSGDCKARIWKFKKINNKHPQIQEVQ